MSKIVTIKAPITPCKVYNALEIQHYCDGNHYLSDEGVIDTLRMKHYVIPEDSQDKDNATFSLTGDPREGVPYPFLKAALWYPLEVLSRFGNHKLTCYPKAIKYGKEYVWQYPKNGIPYVSTEIEEPLVHVYRNSDKVINAVGKMYRIDSSITPNRLIGSDITPEEDGSLLMLLDGLLHPIRTSIEEIIALSWGKIDVIEYLKDTDKLIPRDGSRSNIHKDNLVLLNLKRIDVTSKKT